MTRFLFLRFLFVDLISEFEHSLLEGLHLLSGPPLGVELLGQAGGDTSLFLELMRCSLRAIRQLKVLCEVLCRHRVEVVVHEVLRRYAPQGGFKGSIEMISLHILNSRLFHDQVVQPGDLEQLRCKLLCILYLHCLLLCLLLLNPTRIILYIVLL